MNHSHADGHRDHAHAHGDGCATASPDLLRSPRYRRVLWVALLINVAMFAVEIAGGLTAGSSALLADALDFLGDAANYGISLAVLGLALRWRASAAMLKGVTMGLFGVWVIASTLLHAAAGTVPSSGVMGGIGLLALLANGSVALMLVAFRNGDANMRSVWICSRNDALGNVAVMLAALGVFGTGTMWPDLVVAFGMGALAIWGATQVIAQAMRELRLRTSRAAASAPLA